MLADGIEEINLFRMLAPPELRSEGDDAYTGLWSRRPAFELAIRRVAEAEPGLTIVAPGVVEACSRPRNVLGEPLRVTGLRLDDGSELPADLVLDAGGRRSPVPTWLAELGIDVPTDIQDCGSIYCSRYYRLNPDAGLPLFAILGVRELVHRMSILGFPGDHDTYGLAAFVGNDDEAFKAVRHTWAWDPLMAAFPRVAPWADPANGVPLTDVQFMGGHQNVRRHFVVDGCPLLLNLLPIGDALCTTNPIYGWGASMALTYAFAAVEAAEEHASDPGAMALAYDQAVRDEADGVYRESAAMDRARGYQWRGEEVPAWDREGGSPAAHWLASSRARPLPGAGSRHVAAHEPARVARGGARRSGRRGAGAAHPGDSRRQGGQIARADPRRAARPVRLVGALGRLRGSRPTTGSRLLGRSGRGAEPSRPRCSGSAGSSGRSRPRR